VSLHGKDNALESAPALGPAELDVAYTHLCQSLTRLGQDKALDCLARFALLAISRMPSAAEACALVDAACAPDETG
jgi:hypothetical protein